MRLVRLTLMLLFCATPAAAQVVTPSEMLRSGVQNVIRPAQRAFVVRTDELSAAMAGLCADPSDANLALARSAFGDVATAYGHIQFMRIGPVMEANRGERLLFFPDRRGIGLRQIQAILNEADLSATTLAGLQGKSVAVQGLGALEFVLFGTGAEALAGSEGAFRCSYGATITSNVAEIAGELVAGWADREGIATRLTLPDPSYPDYRTTTEALEALVGMVAHGLEAVRDVQLNPVIASDGEPARPRLALFWRSGQTIAVLGANIEAMRQLVSLSGIAVEPDLALHIEMAFGRALAAIQAVSDPVELAVADPVQATALGDLVMATQELQQLIGVELSSQLGLSVGFSSLDGD